MRCKDRNFIGMHPGAFDLVRAPIAQQLVTIGYPNDLNRHRIACSHRRGPGLER